MLQSAGELTFPNQRHSRANVEMRFPEGLMVDLKLVGTACRHCPEALVAVLVSACGDSNS